MKIDPADTIDREYFRGSYARALVHLIHHWVRPGETCIDAGAQKGYVALQMAARVGAAGRVYSFEPDPRARHMLEAHLDRNAVTQVRMLAYALGPESGMIQFHLSSRLGWSSIGPNPLATPTIRSAIEVNMRSLDGLVGSELDFDLRTLSLVKLDCEGAETGVLFGMRQLLESSRPMLWIEVNSSSLIAAGSSRSKLEGLLRSFGLTAFLPKYTHWVPGSHRLHLYELGSFPAEPEVYDIAALRLERQSLDRLARAGIGVHRPASTSGPEPSGPSQRG